MKIFVAGASGVIGRPLVQKLVERGHETVGMTRREDAAADLARRGIKPVVCDVFDAEAVERAVRSVGPDVLVHQLTSLPHAIDPRKIGEQLASNDRIRTEGTRNLVHAAASCGVGRIVAQSIAFAYAPGAPGLRTEDDPLWLDAPRPWRRSVKAIAELERQVLSANDGGVVLRYGYFYGPGTAYAADGSAAEMVRARRFPVAGAGGGVFSFVHVDDAVDATVAAIESRASGSFNIVDDDPAPQREWLPAYAEALRAPRPMRVPGFLARLAGGRYGHYLLTRQPGASNARARRALAWPPRHASWRTGFAADLRQAPSTEAARG